MTAELEAKLTADIKDLTSKLNKAKSLVSGYGKTVDKEATKAGAGFKKVGKGAANAQPALQEFSRVIQDAPFGIQGVGNNIQQLTANFGNLSKSAGGTVPALKLMISSLAGPGGVLLAVSVVTSALTVFANSGLLKSKTAAEKLAESQKKLSEELDKYRESLRGVNRARLEGNRSAASELVNLRLLKTQIEDTSKSQKLREDGIKQLIKQYPTYFKNVKQEALLNGSLQGTYESLTKAIISRSKATAASDLLIENAKKELVILNQIDDLKTEQAAKELELIKSKTRASSASTNTLVGGAGSFNQKLVAQGIIQEDINSLTKQQLDLQKDIGQLAKENTKLSLFAQANTTIDPSITISNVKTAIDKVKNEFTNLDDIFGITTSAQNALNKFAPDFSNFEVKINKLGDIVGFALKDTVSKVKPQLSNIELALNDFNARAGDIIQNGIGDTFAGLGEAIGNSLVNGGNVLESLGGALLQGIGNIATELGKAAIAVGVGMLAIKASFKNPFTAIAAGVALVALGSSLGAIATNAVSGGSSGGSIGGQGSASTSNTSSAGSNSFTPSGGTQTVVFEIGGDKLYGVLKNFADRSNRLGGNINIG